jgi:hypothetical protein
MEAKSRPAGVKNWSSVTWQTKKNLNFFFGKPPLASGGFAAKPGVRPPANAAPPKPMICRH